MIKKNELSGSAAPPAPLKVLAVDDDRSLLTLYEAITSRWNMPLALTCVDSGAAALHYLQSQAPDVLLLDLQLDDMDGFRLVRELRADARCRFTRVVVVSGTTPADIRRHGELPENTTFLGKPINFPALKALMASLHDARTP